jgi:hypothetical protein
VGEEETPTGPSVQESLKLGSLELEVAINIAASESQVQNLLVRVMRDGREHFRFDR